MIPKPIRRPRLPTVVAPPTANLRVEPTGSLGHASRGYAITLDLELQPAGAGLPSDALQRARSVAAGALRGAAPVGDEQDGPTVHDTIGPRVAGVAGGVTGVATTVLSGDWPTSATMASIRAELVGHGYQVTMSERRACAEPGCTVEAVVDPGHRDARSRDWFSPQICSRHNYRTCTDCASVLRMTSSSASGPAPAVSCPVCQARLVEWGGSKLWEVELLPRVA